VAHWCACRWSHYRSRNSRGGSLSYEEADSFWEYPGLAVDALANWGTKKVPDVLADIAQLIGEIMTSGIVTVSSFPEYFFDSWVQTDLDIQDDLLLVIHDYDPRAESRSAIGWSQDRSEFWVYATDAETRRGISWDYVILNDETVNLFGLRWTTVSPFFEYGNFTTPVVATSINWVTVVG